jgi:phospholipid N-methyltransferase
MREMLKNVPIKGVRASWSGIDKMGEQGPSLGLSIRTFFKRPLMVGSAFPASHWLVRHMLAPLDWPRIKLLVELGPGTGVFTRAALARLPADATLLALDTSRAFVDHLRDSIQDPRLQAVCAQAADVAALVGERGLPLADCILSGVPLSTLDPADAEQTMIGSRAILAPQGMFCAYQMRRTVEPLLRAHIGAFRSAYEWRNIPPCHLYWAEADPRATRLGEFDDRKNRRARQAISSIGERRPRRDQMGDIRPNWGNPDPRAPRWPTPGEG